MSQILYRKNANYVIKNKTRIRYQQFGLTYSLIHSQNHYENVLIQIMKILPPKYDIFHISAQSKDCGYSLEPPLRRGGSNEYPQSMF